MLVRNFYQGKYGLENWKPFLWVFYWVFLYDASWKLLDNRFLNKAEEVSPGKMIEFPGHLVEVGNPEVDLESLRDLNACGNSFSSLHKFNMQKQQHNVTTVNSAAKGNWNRVQFDSFHGVLLIDFYPI